MENFTHKTLTTSPLNLTYSYYLSPNFHQTLSTHKSPILLILHGYPDEAYMWNVAAKHLETELPNTPLLIPDLLGFGGSSKPTTASSYNYKQQANSLAQILDAENVPKSHPVIPIGHDWGSATAQRFYLYHRPRCVGLVLISLAYQPPSDSEFNLDSANAATAKRFGYPQWEYWNFFTSEDAPALMRANLDRFYEVNHGNLVSSKSGEEGRDVWMREMFCVPGAMRDYVAKEGRYKDFTVELKPYAEDQGMRMRFVERMTRDGLEGPVNYYHSLKDNTMLEEERELCKKDSDGKDMRRIEVPLLYIGQRGDWVCRTDLMSDPKEQGLVNDVEERVVDAGHWVLYEKPDEIARLIIEWFKRKSFGK